MYFDFYYKISFSANSCVLYFRGNELDAEIVDRLMNLVYDLVCEGTLNLARLLRRKLLEKCEKKNAESADIAQPVQQSIELSSR